MTQYEAGNTAPRVETVAKLALVLGVPPEYFEHDGRRRRPFAGSRSFFRSLRSTRQSERDQADARAEHIFDLVEYLERRVRLPAVSVPEFADIPSGANRHQIEQVAAHVRCAWGIPSGPVRHVVRALEANGVIVSRLRGGGPRVDAFSRWFATRPLIILWDDKADKARSRFDAAHELGHLVMHHEAQPGERELERQAHAFASAFLMPAGEILESLPRRAPRGADWDYLLDLRRRWGVSLAALLYRARELGTLPEAGFRRAMIRLTEMGLRHDDGAALGAPERPELLGRAVTVLLEARALDLDALARELRFGRRQLDEVLEGQIPYGAAPPMKEESAQVLQLRLGWGHGQQHSDTPVGSEPTGHARLAD